MEKYSFEAVFWRMDLKACTFERLAIISLGFGRNAQVGKTSLLEVEFIYGASVDVGRIQFLFGTLQALGFHRSSRSLEEDEAFFYNAKQR